MFYTISQRSLVGLSPIAHLLLINLPALASFTASLPTFFMASRNHLTNKLHALESWFRSVSRGVLLHKTEGQQLWGYECLGSQERLVPDGPLSQLCRVRAI